MTPVMPKIAKFTQYYFARFPGFSQEAQQEALLTAWKYRGQFRGKGTFEAWIMRIVANTCHNLYKRLRRDGYVELLDVERHELGNRLLSTPPSAAEQELLEKVEEALDGLLTEHERISIILHICNGYTSQEVGDILHQNPSNVRSWIERGLIKIRRYLEKGNHS